MTMVLLLLLRSLHVPRIAACATCITLVWCYVPFSGGHLPVARAAVMATFALAARMCGAKAVSWNALATALIVVALTDPLSLCGASALLSFSCVAGIFTLLPAIEEQLARLALPHVVAEALGMTIATQVATWPLTAATFLNISFSAILANAFVVPFVGTSMLLAVAQLLVAPIAALSQACANINGWVLAWIASVVSTLANIPFAHLPATPAPPWCIALYDAGALAAAHAWKLNRTAALTFLLVGASLVINPPRVQTHMLRITAIDVGQADALLIQTPRGHAILVDGGGRLERGRGAESTAERVGETTVVPFLLRSGVHKLDAIILSHPHGDHVGAAAPILRDGFNVAELADSGQLYRGNAYTDAIQTARADRVPIVYPRAGMVWRTDDGVTLTFIGPSLPFIESDNTINDNSVAFIFQYKQFRMLFTGDAGVAAEERFLDEGIDLHADVLKVGHHGSAYSSSPAFIAAVHPKYAIISVGRHNMFGHPALSTIQTLQHFGTPIYRTDNNGAIGLVSDGARLRIGTVLH